LERPLPRHPSRRSSRAREKAERAVPVDATNADFDDPNVAIVTVSGTQGREFALEVRGPNGSMFSGARAVPGEKTLPQENSLVNGTRLHYLDSGKGPVVLLLHGNGSMARELEISGIFGELAGNYRVLAFDRPGFGYSERSRSVLWTPAAQAELIYSAPRRMGIRNAIVLGHSWGNLVALELALRQPKFVTGLVLAGGFYFPELRADAALSDCAATLGPSSRYLRRNSNHQYNRRH
jgi:hypothetical protein